ncbi:MAG TPA: hypothetical protein VFK21_04565 [Gammaproteobacteria bacterium]|nr:hypothetical protein [Gammaproteobacteria bacterium]
MKRANFARLSAVSLMVLGIFLLSSVVVGAMAAPRPSQAATVADPRLEMVKTLEALGPSPALGDQAKVFGRFVGTWDVDYGEIGADGKVTHFPGELVVGWVMDGHALQDLFIAYPSAAGKERTMGTTLRFVDSKSGKWHVVYIEPPSNTIFELTGGQEGDRIVLYGKDKDGTLARWSFNDIKNDSFTWRDEMSRDGGKTWRLTEEHHMKRRSAEVSTAHEESQMGTPLSRSF